MVSEARDYVARTISAMWSFITIVTSTDDEGSDD